MSFDLIIYICLSIVGKLNVSSISIAKTKKDKYNYKPLLCAWLTIGKLKTIISWSV